MQRSINGGEKSLAEGETIIIDANSGDVYCGEIEVITEYPAEWLDEIRKWRFPVGSKKSGETKSGR